MTYIFPYNEKIWQTDLSAIPIEWLQGKLPMMEPSQILEGNIFKSSDNMVHSTFSIQESVVLSLLLID